MGNTANNKKIKKVGTVTSSFDECAAPSPSGAAPAASPSAVSGEATPIQQSVAQSAKDRATKQTSGERKAPSIQLEESQTEHTAGAEPVVLSSEKECVRLIEVSACSVEWC